MNEDEIVKLIYSKVLGGLQHRNNCDCVECKKGDYTDAEIEEAKRKVVLPNYETGCDHQGLCKLGCSLFTQCFDNQIKKIIKK